MTQDDINFCKEQYVKALREMADDIDATKFKDTTECRREMNKLATRLSKLQEFIGDMPVEF